MAIEAAVIALENNYQVAVMAPTEILATTALSVFQEIARASGLRRRRAHRVASCRREKEDQAAHLRRHRARRRRHARGDLRRCRFSEPWPHRHRRAASVRRNAAPATTPQRRAPRCTGDDCDAHSAYPFADSLRRTRCFDHRRTTPRAQSDRDQTSLGRSRGEGL